MADVPAGLRHVGVSLGRLAHWRDGLGEFSRRLGLALAARAPQLRAERGWALHFHLPARWHGCFGPEVGYLATHTTQRVLHLRPQRFALWHTLHQHIRLRAPLGTLRRLETVHDLNFLRTKTGAKAERYRQALRARLAGRDAVATISRFVAGELATELAPLATPVQVVHNGVTDLRDAPRAPVDGIDPVKPWLLHISRLAPSKNIDALLALAEAWPAMPLVLAGADSPYLAEVRARVAAHGLANVRLCMDISDEQKAWLYAHCTAFVFPSLAEGFGLPPLEAMQFGKPVLLSRLTSLPEVGGDVATYVDAFDGPSMRAATERAIADGALPGRADALRAQAQRFSWTRCAEGYLSLYQTLIDG